MIKNTEYTKEERKKLVKILSNWLTVHEAVVGKVNIELLYKLIKVEAETHNRLHILDRLVTKIISIKRKNMYEELHTEIKTYREEFIRERLRKKACQKG